MNPEFGAAHNNRAFARQQKGDIEGAMADFDAAIQCSPGRAYVYNNRGVARRTSIGYCRLSKLFKVRYWQAPADLSAVMDKVVELKKKR